MSLSMGRMAGDQVPSSIAEIPDRPTVEWLQRLPACNAAQYRWRLKKGGKPVFALHRDSCEATPIWILLYQDDAGQLWRVLDSKDPLSRRLNSVRQVYQAARVARMRHVQFPVDVGQP